MKVEEQESIESMMGERFSEPNIDGENQKVPILTPSGLLLFTERNLCQTSVYYMLSARRKYGIIF